MPSLPVIYSWLRKNITPNLKFNKLLIYPSRVWPYKGLKSELKCIKLMKFKVHVATVIGSQMKINIKIALWEYFPAQIETHFSEGGIAQSS